MAGKQEIAMNPFDRRNTYKVTGTSRTEFIMETILKPKYFPGDRVIVRNLNKKDRPFESGTILTSEVNWISFTEGEIRYYVKLDRMGKSKKGIKNVRVHSAPGNIFPHPIEAGHQAPSHTPRLLGALDQPTLSSTVEDKIFGSNGEVSITKPFCEEFKTTTTLDEEE